jgi:holo-[acyl-carrier protein] synthase
MVFGIGVDLVHVKRIEHILHRWGERFVSRLFTADEKKICYSRPRPASAFAMRFAAKEAFSKALGLGMRMGIRWRDIEVFHFPGGKPGLKVHGTSMDICRERGITGFHVSLTDDGDYAIAMVVLETSVDLVQSP